MKKFLSLVLVLCLCVCFLASCSKTMNDPLKTAKYLSEDYYVNFFVSEADIEDFADTYEVKSKGIYCIVSAYHDGNEGKSGMLIYCDNTDFAKEMAEDLEDVFDKEENKDIKEDFIRFTIETSGKIVFVGCDDVWDEVLAAK